MSDDGRRIVLILLHELFGAGKRDLVDVPFDLFGRHADSAVGDDELAVFDTDAHGQVAQFAFEIADRR